MSDQTTVGQYLVDRLHQLGLEHLFSIPGDYTIEWLDTYVVPSRKIRVISEVNELNAGYAADGYARQKGKKGIGALCVTYSAGALSAANPIAGAYAERVPVVLINWAPSAKQRNLFEQTGFIAHHFIAGRQTDRQVFEYITAAAVTIDNPHLAPMLIDYALTQCITERRPVYIELLEDMVSEPCRTPKDKLSAFQITSDRTILHTSVAMIKSRIEASENPIIWLGVEVDRYGLEEQAELLMRELNIPFVTQLMSKAVLSENHPQFAGVFDGKASSDAVQDLVRNADFILALGVWLTDINTLGWPPDLDKTAYVSFGTVKLGTYFGAQVSLTEFMDALKAAEIRPKDGFRPSLPTQENSRIDLDDKIDYQGFYDFVPRYITNDTIIGSDASLNYFGTLLLKVGVARGYFAQPSYSSIGYIGAAATGICLARGDRKQQVMIFTGDGGFQMTALCVATQTRFQLNPIIFVVDNGVFAVEQWLADAGVFMEPDAPFKDGLHVHPCSYSRLAAVVKCKGWRVTTYRELDAAITHAQANRKSPSIIQVVVPPKSIPKNAKWKALIDANRNRSNLDRGSVRPERSRQTAARRSSRKKVMSLGRRYPTIELESNEAVAGD